jgi:hypothetical protein
VLLEKYIKEVLKASGRVYVYMCHDPEWFGGCYVDNFEKDAIEESNPYGLVTQVIGVDWLYGFESLRKLDDPKSRSKVDDIKELIKSGEDKELPPVLVREGGEAFKFQVVDGHHRYWAYKELSEEEDVVRGVVVRIVPSEMIKDVMTKDELPFNARE